jgi:uncharacterized protein YneR
MKLMVTEQAFDWLKRELNLQAGDSVRLFVRYGGCGGVHAGFSLGIHKEKHKKCGLEHTLHNIRFFMEQEDVWYLDGRDLIVDYDPETDEIRYRIEPIEPIRSL